jgi:hypothetical protein
MRLEEAVEDEPGLNRMSDTFEHGAAVVLRLSEQLKAREEVIRQLGRQLAEMEDGGGNTVTAKSANPDNDLFANYSERLDYLEGLITEERRSHADQLAVLETSYVSELRAAKEDRDQAQRRLEKFESVGIIRWGLWLVRMVRTVKRSGGIR